ncbi:MAG: ABC transporter permease subunit [Saprospirales bacterium]|nr:ABC transporter permease subunit [Saprospirales bacterium]
MFQLRGPLTSRQALLLGIAGIFIFLALWWLLAEAFSVDRSKANRDLPEDPDAVEVVSGIRLHDADPTENRVMEKSGDGAYTGLTLAFPDSATSGAGATFSLSDDASGIFAVDPLSGRISVARAAGLDYERSTSLSIVANGTNPKGGKASASFFIQIGDVDEFPIGKIEDIDPAPNEAGRKSYPGAGTGLTVYAKDGDAGDAVSYRLTAVDGSPFAVNPRSGQVTVADTVALKAIRGSKVFLGVEAISEDGSASADTFEISLVEHSQAAAPSQDAGGSGGRVYPILPTPGMVVNSFPELVNEDKLIPNTLQSLWINVQGYLWAVLISIPIGFIIGLMPLAKGLFSKQVDALRYLPLTALTGLFIIWFGIENEMKVAFLAFGIIVYLLPVVVQRIFEVEEVYTTTVFTLGASNWQTIRTVYFPAVMSKLIDDIRVLTAISWTYIIIAELVNRQGDIGGIGALIYIKARQGEIPKVFAMLIVIILIGFLQDRIFVWMDRRLFPHKYFKTMSPGLRETEAGFLVILGMLVLVLLQRWLLPSFAEWMNLLAVVTVVSALLIIVYGEIKIWRAGVQA